MELTVTDTLAENWKYISEGAATAVFSYVGPPDSRFDHTVLRLRKRRGSSEDSSTGRDSEDPVVAFQHKCMERLIPSVNLPKLSSVRVDRTWLEKLVKIHIGERRAEDGRGGDWIDLSRTRAVLATNLVNEGLAIEIKPKWGFLPDGTHLSELTRGIKTHMCRFCMHTRARGAKQLENFCPLDLYSAEEDRVKKAVSALYDAWMSGEPMNNLKVFKGGNQIYSAGMIEMMGLDEGMAKNMFVSIVALSLTKTPVLQIISRLQRTLDVLDIEQVARLWRNASDNEKREPTMDEWGEFLDQYERGKNGPEDDVRYHLMAYLLSATFKDCSVMMSVDLRMVGEPQGVWVIDLDVKKMDKFEKWEKLDREIVLANLGNEKVCVDKWADSDINRA